MSTTSSPSFEVSLLGSFPELQHAWVDDVSMNAATLIESFEWTDYAERPDDQHSNVTHIDARIRLGAAFSQTIRPTSEERSDIRIVGTVDRVSGTDVIADLRSVEPMMVDFANFGHVLMDVNISSRLTSAVDSDGKNIVELFADLVFPRIAISEEKTVQLSTRVSQDSSKLRLTGRVDDSSRDVNGFSMLAGFLGPAIREADRRLGDPLDALAEMRLASVQMELDSSNPRLVSLVGVSLEADHAWHAVGDAERADPTARLEVELIVFDPFGEHRSLSAEVVGTFDNWSAIPRVLEVEKLTAWTTVEATREAGTTVVSFHGGLASSLKLNSSETLDIQLPLPLSSDAWRFDLTSSAAPLTPEALEAFLHVSPLPGPLAAVLDSVRIPHVGLTVNPSPLKLRDVSAKMDLANPLSLIDDKLVLDAVDVDLYVDDPVGKPAVTGSVTGHLAIGAGSVQLYVGRHDSAEQWAVAVGATDIDLGTISDVVVALQRAAGGPDWSSHVPAALASRRFKLTRLSIDYVFDPTQFHGLGIELDSPKSGTGGILDMVDARLSIDVDHSSDAHSTKFKGVVDIAGHDFELDFERAGADVLLAGFYVNSAGTEISLSDIIAKIAPNAVGPGVDLDIRIEDAFFAHGDGWELVGADIDGRLDLSNLPMVGKALPAHGSISLDLRAMAASSDITAGDVRRLNALLPKEIRHLPDDPADAATKVSLHEGVALLAALRLAEAHVDLDLPVTLSDGGEVVDRPTGVAKPPAADSAVEVPADSIHWIKVQRHFGPIHFQRVGAAISGSDLTFAIDASVDVGGLTLSLDGLSVSTPLKNIHPTFGLRGIGIDYSNGDIEVGGALLLLGEDDFAGAATITTPQLTLSALGAYTNAHGHPSMFVSAVLDSPIGGPAFFYVTGLSAAFGYNRSLVMPPVEGVCDFPLVEQARRGAGADIDLGAELALLAKAIPVDIGQNFLAIGVKFTSFKQIDSFALLAVQFGHQTEIDLLGVSHLVVPAPAPDVATPPVADIEIGLRGQFIPDQGILRIDARLTPNSYVLSTDCHLTGGFAFYSWFKGANEGDFVLSVGGYHPNFVPTNKEYPTVPRVGFNWTIAPHVTIKGSGYFSLTPDMMMAGGHLEATYHNGHVQAWFQLTIDVLLAWQPFHYKASMSVHIGGSYTFEFLGTHTISVDVGAALSIRGPDFSGHAEIDVKVAKISVDFGRPLSPTTTITWVQFKESFLPSADSTVGVTVEQGMVKGGASPHDLGIVNPAELRISTSSAIPCTSVTVNTAPLDGILDDAQTVVYPGIGVGPCGVAVGALHSTHEITLKVVEGTIKTPIERPKEWFVFKPITKNSPAAMWGAPTAGRPPLRNGASPLVEQTVVGVSIVARRPQADDQQAHPTATAEQTVTPVVGPTRSAISDNPFTKLTNAAIGRIADVGTVRSAALHDLELDPSFVRVGRLPATVIRSEGRQ